MGAEWGGAVWAPVWALVWARRAMVESTMVETETNTEIPLALNTGHVLLGGAH